MRKMSLGLSTMLAIAAAGMSIAIPTATEVAAAKTQRPSRTTQTGRSYRRIGNGYRYPEQSSRQSMRGSRRAQGGPGIYLAGDNRYHAVF